MQWHHAGKKILAGALGLTLSGGITAANGAADSHEKYERLWRHATLHQSDQGPMQNFALSGRLQSDYAWFDAARDGGEYDGWGVITALRLYW